MVTMTTLLWFAAGYVCGTLAGFVMGVIEWRRRKTLERPG